MTKVFISYSHDSDTHREFVRGIADRLRREGVDCLIDRYVNGFPPEGWPRWMESQIEAADFVLLVCTETYLRRYRGQETEGGRGVNFEGVVISQTLYDHYYQNSKFIPVIPDDGDFGHVPLPLKPCSTYRLNSQYDDVYRILTGQAEYVKPELGDVRLLPTARTIFSDDLPTVEGELFGRKDELALLDEARVDPETRIVQFVASGGTGKTKLIRHWLDENNEKIDALIAWSFYSQGSSEDKQISATPFFMQALKSLGSDKSVSDFNTEEEKGEYVANLLREKRCLLVLDGLEPLQQVGRGMRGELKDRAIRKLLRCLVGDHSSLCIITTRLPVHELKSRRQVVQHDLQNLAPEDGVALLRSFGVSGRDADMLAAVEEYGRHALALHLLGNALATYLDGDVRKRDTLTELIGDYDEAERHAFKVMQAYEHWLEGTPELKLLYLLGLFDHPVGQDVLEVLWEAEIPGLTAGVDKRAWLVARRDLISGFRMMSETPSPQPLSLTGRGAKDNMFDCHPLIREYFGGQLKEKQEEVWRQAHTVLYEYYKGLPEKFWGKYLPGTFEETEPLFLAIVHGCAAGKYERVFEEDFIERIEQDKTIRLLEMVGHNDVISILANFFTSPWDTSTVNLSDLNQAILYSRLGWCLGSVGRIKEAVSLYEVAIPIFINHLDRKSAAVCFYMLSGNELLQGNIELSDMAASLGIELSDSDIDNLWKEKICNACFKGNSYLAMDSLEASLEAFKSAEELQYMYQPYSFLYSIQGYYFCNLLLEINKPADALIRAEDVFEYEENGFYSLVSSALHKLIIGRAWQLVNGGISGQLINESISKLRKSGDLGYLCEALFARALLNYHSKLFNTVWGDLIEIYEIAEPSGMRLHLTDYHLEMAHLILAVEADPTQYPEATPDREQRILPFADQEEPGILTLQGHIAEADRLINETGYHRRDAELAELKQQAGMS